MNARQPTLPMHGVAVDAGSGLADLLRQARGAGSRNDDLATFKRCVVRELSPLATTLLVDAEVGPSLLADFAPSCAPMLAYEADVYRIAGSERITVLPENLAVADYPGMGVRHLKLFMYYAARGSAAANQRKQSLIAEVGAECRRNGVHFLFEPLVYDEDVSPGSVDYARLKPILVRETTAVFADPAFAVDLLKVEVPLDLDYVEGFGGSLISRAEAVAALHQAAEAAGAVPMVYLSAGVSFDRFRTSLAMAREAGVPFSGFMCGRAIWADGIAVFGSGGQEALTSWLGTVGHARFQALVEAATPGRAALTASA